MFIEWAWECSLLCNFLEKFQKKRCYLFSGCLVELSWKAIRSWTFVFWKFFNHIFNFSTGNLSSYFVFLPGSVLVGCIFVSICPFLWGCPFLRACPFYWHTVDHSSLLSSYIYIYIFIYFWSVGYNFSFFISNYIDLKHFPLFLDKNGWRIINFIDLFKEPTFGFIDFLNFFLCLYVMLLIFALIFMISFLLIILAFVFFFFSRCLRCKISLFTWGFSSFLR